MKSIIRVDRYCNRKGKESHEASYFISSLPPSLAIEEFYQGIRNHWLIESYHYLKDVTFKEDRSRVVTGNAPPNISILKTIVINILRRQKEENIAKSIRMIAHKVRNLWLLILE